MPAEPMEQWLRSGRPARIDGISYQPVEHQQITGMPLSVQRGQAEAFFLVDERGVRLVLKKFSGGRTLDRAYLEAVTRILPGDEGFHSGSQRRVLGSHALGKSSKHYDSTTLGGFLDGAVLMPVAPGRDWSAHADDLRDGSLTLDVQQRMTVARSLIGLIDALECCGCCHRDLSSGNVFINIEIGTVALIDYDSLYHPKLAMPSNTTAGISGYVTPFVYRDGAAEPTGSWCPKADCFALALLVVELLVLEEGTPLAEDGGMFDQSEICARSGRTLMQALDRFQVACPEAVPLFENVLRARDFASCPAPDAWIHALQSTRPVTPAQTPAAPGFWTWLSKLWAPAAVPSVPRLSDVPAVSLSMPTNGPPVVTLPPDPWKD